jgi:integrase
MSEKSEEIFAIAIVPKSETAIATRRERLKSAADKTSKEADNYNTEITYKKAWAAFDAWCDEMGSASLPAEVETVRLYLTELAERAKVATVRLHLTVINRAHRLAGHDRPGEDELIKRYMSGLRKEKAKLGKVQDPKKALTPEVVADLILTLDLTTRAGLRDRLVILLAYAMAARREELSALEVSDLVETPTGLDVLIRISKTGHGEIVPVPRIPRVPLVCPVVALHAWLTVSEITTGPVFRRVDRHDHVLGSESIDSGSVARILKRALRRAGFQKDALKTYSGHSFRRGLASSASSLGANRSRTQHHLRHRDPRMTDHYAEEALARMDNPATLVFNELGKIIENKSKE